MSIDRRYFLKGIMGSGLIVLSAASIKPIDETVEERIQRLFSIDTINIKSSNLPSHIKDYSLKLRESEDGLLRISDKAFVEIIDSNIRQDFSENHIIEIAGWQLSRTEIAILSTIGIGRG